MVVVGWGQQEEVGSPMNELRGHTARRGARQQVDPIPRTTDPTTRRRTEAAWIPPAAARSSLAIEINIPGEYSFSYQSNML
jgi:hypothetical protein